MSPATQIHSAAMAASAGTGKTFALSSRYLALLACGVEPESLVALTFTRKAAGEILSRILTRLAAAAGDETNFLRLNTELRTGQLPEFPSRTAAQASLRALVQALPALRIGTLDSFFLQILRQFRLEIGIAAAPAIAPDLQTAEEDLVLQRLLGEPAARSAEQAERLEAFRLATFGEEKKGIYRAVQNLIGDQYELYCRVTDAAAWGDATRIWPQGLPAVPEPDWSRIIAALETQGSLFPPGQAREDWDRFSALVAARPPGGDLDFKNSLAKRIYLAFAAPAGCPSSVRIRRTDMPLAQATQTALRTICSYLRFQLLGRQVVRTRGLYRFLAAYGLARNEHIVRTGELAFADVTRLLGPAARAGTLRHSLDYRLDARFRHWLLDEFQDTSLGQWTVIEDLLDEVIQNPDGERTFFYVGDVKQAIYQWRGGDPRLFRRILAKYNRPGHQAIEVAPALIRSWRSSPTVLQAVNRIFSNLAAQPVPDDKRDDWSAVAARWTDEWTAHEPAERNRQLSGHVALHVLPRPTKDDPDADGEADAPAIQRAAELVEQLAYDIPHFRNLSVALLARGNDEGLAIRDALARRGLRSVWAGNSELLDNTLIPSILALARLIEHPGDEFARRHVAMSPLADRIPLAPADLAAWARVIRARGYAGFATQLAARLDLESAPLERTRLQLLISVAAEFDRQPGGNALRFDAFVRGQEIPAEQSGSNIHVLTMHKAKGLEFDLVVLPALGNRGIGSRSQATMLVHERPGNEPAPVVDWVLTAPEAAAIEVEPPLAALQTENLRSRMQEELRLLYVAMTRARRALHLITIAPGEKSTTLRLDDLVQNALAPRAAPDAVHPVWEDGDRNWWTACAPPSSIPRVSGPAFADLPQAPVEQPPPARIASQEAATGHLPTGRDFRPEGAEARDLGTRIHALFEQIEWLAPGAIPEFPDAAPADARLVADALKNPAVHALFEKPSAPVELLREQAFEAMLDGQWLSGKIDRLMLERAPSGNVIRARVYDFKTDRIPTPDRHRPQMEDYRRAVAALYGLPPAQVAGTLLFIRAGQISEL